MEPGHRSPCHRVSDFRRVGLGHGSVCQTRCLTRFWVLTYAFIMAFFLQSNTISANWYLHNFTPSALKVQILTIYCYLLYLFQLVPAIFTCVLDQAVVEDLFHSAQRPGHGSKILTRFRLWLVPLWLLWFHVHVVAENAWYVLDPVDKNSWLWPEIWRNSTILLSSFLLFIKSASW